jgi:hypothetical protein
MLDFRGAPPSRKSAQQISILPTHLADAGYFTNLVALVYMMCSDL